MMLLFKNLDILTKLESESVFHKNPEFLPLKSKKPFPLFIDFGLKSSLSRERVWMRISGSNIVLVTPSMPTNWAGNRFL